MAADSQNGAVRDQDSDQAFGRKLRELVDWLAPDFAAVIAAPTEQGGRPRVLAAHQRPGMANPLADPSIGPVLGQIITAGHEMAHGAGAWRRAGAGEFVRKHQFECWIGLPLAAGHHTGLGALVVGRREALPGIEVALHTLHVFAHTFASWLELRRMRGLKRVMGSRDPLTGLPDRVSFDERLESAIREAHEVRETCAVVLLGLDRFKHINDSLGHAVGDQVLVVVARRLRDSLRAADMAARHAGDEFAVLLRHINRREEAVRAAEKIARALEAPITFAGKVESSVAITVSLGLSFHPDDAADAKQLVEHADAAMHAAKSMGYGNVQTYAAAPKESRRPGAALGARLGQALPNDELRVFYQAQIDSRSEDIVGMEALLRWEHPDLGMISPGVFIPLAEESGLIVPIGEWILRTACRDAQHWQTRYGLPLRIGVNLSALQLRQASLLLRAVDRILMETGMDPRLLDLEITENINAKSIPGLLDTLHTLRKLGCGISIDDFGTGQSSLDYIKRLPADRIKIDQSFVRNIGIDPDDEAIVQATITMAHNLNRQVVAEGIETEQHLEFLREQKCEILQGFLFCRPLPAADFENLLREREALVGSVAPMLPMDA